MHLPIAARHSLPVADSNFKGSTTSRMFSRTRIHDKLSSSRGDNSIISIHDSSPDFSTRDVVIRWLFVRLSKTYYFRYPKVFVSSIHPGRKEPKRDTCVKDFISQTPILPSALEQAGYQVPGMPPPEDFPFFVPGTEHGICDKFQNPTALSSPVIRTTV
jgi:hypothetical protein